VVVQLNDEEGWYNYQEYRLLVNVSIKHHIPQHTTKLNLVVVRITSLLPIHMQMEVRSSKAFVTRILIIIHTLDHICKSNFQIIRIEEKMQKTIRLLFCYQQLQLKMMAQITKDHLGGVDIEGGLEKDLPRQGKGPPLR
jgi:hypothetical protein